MSLLSEGHRKKGERKQMSITDKPVLSDPQTFLKQTKVPMFYKKLTTKTNMQAIDILSIIKRIQVYEVGNYQVGMRCGVEGARPK